MTNTEAIETLELMQGQIEWDYPMDYAVAVGSPAKVIKYLDSSISIGFLVA